MLRLASLKVRVTRSLYAEGAMYHVAAARASHRIARQRHRPAKATSSASPLVGNIGGAHLVAWHLTYLGWKCFICLSATSPRVACAYANALERHRRIFSRV